MRTTLVHTHWKGTCADARALIVVPTPPFEARLQVGISNLARAHKKAFRTSFFLTIIIPNLFDAYNTETQTPFNPVYGLFSRFLPPTSPKPCSASSSALEEDSCFDLQSLYQSTNVSFRLIIRLVLYVDFDFVVSSLIISFCIPIHHLLTFILIRHTLTDAFDTCSFSAKTP